MTQKIYRSAQGKLIDLGALEAQHQHVRAVGNMNVNARGDKLDADGNVISTRAQQVNRNLNRSVNTAAGPIPTSSRDQQELEQEMARAAQQEKIEKARAQRQALREKGAAPAVESPESGLAAALARANKIKDEE
jgi:hypothetical protein